MPLENGRVVMMILSNLYLKSGFGSEVELFGNFFILLIFVIILGPVFWFIGINNRIKREQDVDSNSEQSSIKEDDQDTKGDE